MTTKFLSIDLELNQPSGRLIQVGVALGSIEQPESDWLVRQWLIDPGEPIAPAIQELTGITDDAIQQASVPLSAVARELGERLAAPHFVNPITWGGGDMPALLAAFADEQVEFPHFGRRWLDVKTLHIAHRLALGKSATGGLASVMGQYGLQFKGKAHRADVDAFNTLRLFFKLQERQRKVAELLALAKTV